MDTTASQYHQVSSITSVSLFGFSNTEQRLADASIKLANRREPALRKLAPALAHAADVLLIDGKGWTNVELEHAAWFDDKVIIRVDSDASHFAHSHIKRPVEWRSLPYIIALAKEKHDTQQQTSELPSLTPEQLDEPSNIKNILVVDDSYTVREHLEAIIVKKGLTAVTASSVFQALVLFEKQHFDCVLMDITMPEVDGYQGCKMIKRLKKERDDGSIVDGKHTPIIMLTSKSGAFDKIKGKIAGCDAYLTKPTTVDKLFSTIDAVTGSSQAHFY